MKVKVATANIKGFLPMRQAKVRSDLLAMRRTFPNLLATQEMWLGRYKTALRRVFTGWRHVTPAYRSACASYDVVEWKELGRRVIDLHPAIPGVCDKRVGSLLRLQHRKSGAIVWFLSIHPAPPATRKSAWAQREAAKARQKAWDVIEALVASTSRPVIVAGDFNAPGQPLGTRIAGRVVRYVSNNIDHIIFIDGAGYRWAIDRDTKRVVALKSDHDGLYVEAELVPKG